MTEIVIFQPGITNPDEGARVHHPNATTAYANAYLAEQLKGYGFRAIIFTNYHRFEPLMDEGWIFHSWWYDPDVGSGCWTALDAMDVSKAYIDIPRNAYNSVFEERIRDSDVLTLNSARVREIAHNPALLTELSPGYAVPTFVAVGDEGVKELVSSKNNVDFGDAYQNGYFVVKPMDDRHGPKFVNGKVISEAGPFTQGAYLVQPLLVTGSDTTAHAFRATMSGTHLVDLVRDTAPSRGGLLVGPNYAGEREYFSNPISTLADIPEAMDCITHIGTKLDQEGGSMYEIHFAIGQDDQPHVYGIRTSLNRIPREWNGSPMEHAKRVADHLARRIDSFVLG